MTPTSRGERRTQFATPPTTHPTIPEPRSERRNAVGDHLLVPSDLDDARSRRARQHGAPAETVPWTATAPPGSGYPMLPRVSVVIPTFNEAKNLPHVLSAIPAG